MSGRSSCRFTPVTRSMSSTRAVGARSHWETACDVTPMASASLVMEPAVRMASRRAADFMHRM